MCARELREALQRDQEAATSLAVSAALRELRAAERILSWEEEEEEERGSEQGGTRSRSGSGIISMPRVLNIAAMAAAAAAAAASSPPLAGNGPRGEATVVLASSPSYPELGGFAIVSVNGRLFSVGSSGGGSGAESFLDSLATVSAEEDAAPGYEEAYEGGGYDNAPGALEDASCEAFGCGCLPRGPASSGAESSRLERGELGNAAPLDNFEGTSDEDDDDDEEPLLCDRMDAGFSSLGAQQQQEDDDDVPPLWGGAEEEGGDENDGGWSCHDEEEEEEEGDNNPCDDGSSTNLRHGYREFSLSGSDSDDGSCGGCPECMARRDREQQEGRAARSKDLGEEADGPGNKGGAREGHERVGPVMLAVYIFSPDSDGGTVTRQQHRQGGGHEECVGCYHIQTLEYTLTETRGCEGDEEGEGDTFEMTEQQVETLSFFSLAARSSHAPTKTCRSSTCRLPSRARGLNSCGLRCTHGAAATTR